MNSGGWRRTTLAQQVPVDRPDRNQSGITLRYFRHESLKDLTPAAAGEKHKQDRKKLKSPALIPCENKRIIHNWRVLLDPSHNLLFLMIKTDTMEDERSKDYPKYRSTTHRVH